MFEHPEKHDRDLKILHPQSTTAKRLKAMTATLPDPILYSVIPLLLDFTTAECQVVDQIRSILIREVVAQAWNPARLEDCQRRLAAGQVAPPIEAEEYFVGNDRYYLLTDGNHRTIARRIAGKRTIRAIIKGENQTTPERTWIIGQDAWRETETVGCLKLIRRNLSEPERAMLIQLGAQQKDLLIPELETLAQMQSSHQMQHKLETD